MTPPLLSQLLKHKRLTKAGVIEQADMDHVYADQIFSGTRFPSRDNPVQLYLGVKVVQQMLKSVGVAPLYLCDKRDSMLILALNQSLSVVDTNCLLADLGEKLSTEKLKLGGGAELAW